MKISKSFLGSNIIMGLGILLIASGINGTENSLFAGSYIILGTSAYKSLKKTKLGLVKGSKLRRIFEILALVTIVLSILLQNNVLDEIYTDPFTFTLVPLFVIIAYASLFFRKAEAE